MILSATVSASFSLLPAKAPDEGYEIPLAEVPASLQLT